MNTWRDYIKTRTLDLILIKREQASRLGVDDAMMYMAEANEWGHPSWPCRILPFFLVMCLIRPLGTVGEKKYRISGRSITENN